MAPVRPGDEALDLDFGLPLQLPGVDTRVPAGGLGQRGVVAQPDEIGQPDCEPVPRYGK